MLVSRDSNQCSLIHWPACQTECHKADYASHRSNDISLVQWGLCALRHAIQILWSHFGLPPSSVHRIKVAVLWELWCMRTGSIDVSASCILYIFIHLTVKVVRIGQHAHSSQACTEKQTRARVRGHRCFFSLSLRWFAHLGVCVQIHWFSIFNSFMMVIFLVGLVSMILMRTLRKDYARYSKEDLDDMVRVIFEVALFFLCPTALSNVWLTCNVACSKGLYALSCKSWW